LRISFVHEPRKEISSGMTFLTGSRACRSTAEFQSRLTQDIPNDSIAWETLPDSQVQSTGFVRFDESRDGSTRVSVQMSYLPPAGVMGHAVAQLFGVDPRQAMQEDLIRLKSLLEEGKTSAEGRL
jgi:uncharacterized membrane protein